MKKDKPTRAPSPLPTAGQNHNAFTAVETAVELDGHFRSLGIDEVRLFRAELHSILARIVILENHVNEVFGKPLRGDLPPHAPENQRRFDAYIRYTGLVIRLMIQVHGMLMDLHSLEFEDEKRA